MIRIKEKREGEPEMADIKVKLTYDEKKVIIMGLIELKNKLIEEDRYTDRVDDLLMKLMK